MALIFPGMVILWSGTAATVPEGWAICNGSNGTPDLRDRFVMGYGPALASSESTGFAELPEFPMHSTGGTTYARMGDTNRQTDMTDRNDNASVFWEAHNVTNPSTLSTTGSTHSHTYGNEETLTQPQIFTGLGSTGWISSSPKPNNVTSGAITADSGAHSHAFSSDAVSPWFGNDEPHSTIPYHMALLYIMKT
jgi:hypothetical protein